MSITWIARIIFSHATEALNLMNTYHESLTTTLSWNTCGYGQKNSLYRPIPPKNGLMWLDTKNNSSASAARFEADRSLRPQNTAPVLGLSPPVALGASHSPFPEKYDGDITIWGFLYMFIGYHQFMRNKSKLIRTINNTIVLQPIIETST